jgi:hypothetical protein
MATRAATVRRMNWFEERQRAGSPAERCVAFRGARRRTALKRGEIRGSWRSRPARLGSLEQLLNGLPAIIWRGSNLTYRREREQ